MTVYITTLDAITRQLDKALPTNPSTTVTANYADYSAFASELIGQASDWLEDYTGRYFIPRVEQRSYYWRDIALRKYMGRSELILDNDLLSVASITSGGSTSSASDYYLAGYGQVDQGMHYNRVVFNTISSNGDFDDRMAILGTWGYSQYWSTVQTLAGDINSSVTSISKTGTFEAYQYLKIDDEIMLITAYTSNALTVVRGVLGTTQASHSTGAAMKVLTPHPSAVLCVTRLVAWLYQKRTDVGDVVQVGDGAVIISQAPAIIKQTANQLRRFDLGAV